MYSFGLVMAGISSKAAGTIQNKEKTFQDQRFDDELGLNWVQFKWRNHDPQIGRFIEIDPLSNDYLYYSPYSFSGNKVTTHVELEGLEEAWFDRKDMIDHDKWGKNEISTEQLRSNRDSRATAGAIGIGITGASILGVYLWVAAAPEISAAMGIDVAAFSQAAGVTSVGGAAMATKVRASETVAEAKALSKVERSQGETEIVQRAMSTKELKVTQSEGLIRGGREGTHYVSDAIGNDAKKVRQRLALPQTPEVKVSLEVPKGVFSNATKVQEANKMPGGGLERKATGNIPAKVIKVEEFKGRGS